VDRERDLPGRVVVLGAGTMGARIALFLALAGLDVCATARRPDTLRQAAATIRSAWYGRSPADLHEAGTETEAHLEEVLARISFTTDGDRELARADLVIETIAENLTDKLALLARIGAVVRPEAILTTNTSSLDLTALAGAIARPGRFAGLHWFNPADLVALVEIVPAQATEVSTVRTLERWMTELGKTPVVLRRAVPGFVANRLQYALLREAYALVAAGVCTWEEADLTVTSCLGPRWAALGPLQCMDLAGLDVHLAVARALFPDLSTDTEPPRAVVELVAAGRLGVKSGAGLLGDYPPQRRDFLSRLRDVTLRFVADAHASVRPVPPPA
jgi:3-hydroxybutyryl-CoA dehydrogenase